MAKKLAELRPIFETRQVYTTALKSSVGLYRIGGMSTVAIADKMVTVPQAAEMIGVTAGRVHQMMREGEIHAEQIPAQKNGRWLLSIRDVERIASQEQKTGRPRSGKKTD